MQLGCRLSLSVSLLLCHILLVHKERHCFKFGTEHSRGTSVRQILPACWVGNGRHRHIRRRRRKKTLFTRRRKKPSFGRKRFWFSAHCVFTSARPQQRMCNRMKRTPTFGGPEGAEEQACLEPTATSRFACCNTFSNSQRTNVLPCE